MITLYKKDGVTKIGVLTDCIECLVEEERNGMFEVSLVYPLSSNLCSYLVEENIIECNANDTLLNQKFRIYLTRKAMDNTIEIYARHISFDLMYDYIDNISFENQSCEYALNQLFRSSNFSKHYKGYSDIVNAQDYSMSMANVLEAIGGKKGSIIDTFGTGAEILRDNENIHVLNKRGYDNEVTIEYKKNLTGFELEEDTTDLVTRISPYAKYTDNETNEEILVKASYVDSPLIANYSHPYIKSIDYSDKFEDGEIPTVSKLQKLAKKEYKDNKVDIPKQNFKIEFIPLSKCVGYEGLEDKISLCDTVTIKDTRYNINTQAKVIKTVFNVLKNRYESMELGEPRTSLGDVIGGGNNDPIVGPPGPQGPPGADGNIGDFPNSLPSTPVVTTKVYGFANIEISWTFENKVYYQYEVYASKEADFTPNTFNLIHQGQTSTYMYQAKPNETWYFKVCALNTHGDRTNFGSASAVTVKIDDLSNYVEEMAIGDALIGELNLGRGWVGELKGNYIDAKQLSVTDGNGERTLDIDSFGNVHIKATSFSLQGKDIATEEELNKAVKSVDVMYYLSNSQTSLSGGNWSTTAPAWVNGKYMWSKTVTTFVNGTKSETSPVCIAGAKGDTGEAGKDGIDGTNGVGIKSVTNYYLASSNSSGVTVSTGGWTTTVQSPSLSKKYLWNYEKITYTDNSYINTTPCIIGNHASDGVNGTDGVDGTNGVDGADGKGISSIVEYYLVSPSSSGITTSTNGWTTTIPSMTATNKYLWNYEKITYTTNETTISKPKVIGVYGDKGDAGADGSDGIGVKEIVEQYYLSTSKTQQVGGSWLSSPPTWVKGKYLWTRSKITYTDSTVGYTTPVCDSSWEAIEQQTSVDIFNKLTDNGKKQGLYMENDQLYINGQYVNAKNLSVVNNEGKQTFKIDSSGNVDIDPSSIEIGFNGINNRISINSRSMDFVASNGNKDMLLYGGQVCIYNNINDTFMSTMGSVLKADTSYKGVGFLLGKNANIFTIGRDTTWTDIMTNRSPNPIHYITFNFDTNQADIDMQLNTNDINMRNCSLRNSIAVGTQKLQTNSWYDLNNNPLFTLNSYWGHVDMYQDLEANYNAILNARLVNPQNSYAISSGYNVDVKNDADVLIANEKISTVSENGEVNYDMNEMIKLLYSKIHTLEKEIESLKGGV